MRLRYSLPLIFALAIAPAGAADIPAAQAAAHAGQTATVIGVLSNAHTDAKQMTFLDIGGVYPNNVFSAVMFPNPGRPAPDFSPLVGKTVAITGEIKIFKGKPEIVLHSPDQVKVAH